MGENTAASGSGVGPGSTDKPVWRPGTPGGPLPPPDPGRPPLLGAGLLAGAGLADVLASIGALFADPYVIITPEGLDHLDLTGWTWLNFCIGSAVILTGLIALANRRWAATLAIAAAVASIAIHVLLFAYHPQRTLLIGALDAVAIRLLVRHRRLLRAAELGPPTRISGADRPSR